MKIFKRIFLIVFCFLILYTTENYILENDYFKIKNIELIQNNNMIEKDITSKLSNLKEESILLINSSKIKKIIASDVRVESVNIKKKYPDTIIIDLKIKEPYVYIRQNEKFYLADDTFEIMGYLNEQEHKNIPIISFKNGENLNDYRVLLSNIKNEEMFRNISEIRKKDTYYEVVLLDSVVIITDTTIESDKYEKTYKLYKKLKKEKNIGYIDIRFKDVNVK